MSDRLRDLATRRRHFYQRRWVRWSVGGLLAAIVVVLLAFNFSPRPGAFLIRRVFEQDSEKVKAALEAHAPTTGVSTITNEPYRPGDRDALLDVYVPEATGAGERLPVLVWTHGGAWISGSKDDAAPYFKLIASEGYAVVALNYSLGPDTTYPTAVHQINDALAYLQQHAERLHLDVNRIVMAGDSAGAQLTSQIAALITSHAYAAELGIVPALRPEQLRGVILNCGIYDMATFLDHSTIPKTVLADLLVWGTDTSVWAHTGNRDTDTTATRQMSTVDHVTADFPATWITGGNGDPLTDEQSKPFADRLAGLGVDVTTLFYPEDHQPSLPHEYQFNLDTADGQHALDSMLAFLRERTESEGLSWHAPSTT
jgi:acetyl esterase/lipase